MAFHPAHARLRVIAGPNGSGKSTILNELKTEWIGCFVNADRIEHELVSSGGQLRLAEFGFRQHTADLSHRLGQHIRQSAFAKKLGLHALVGQLTVDNTFTLHIPGPYNSYVASVVADAIRRELLAQGQTFTFETVMSSRDKVDFMWEARERGYRVYLYFVATDDPEINLDRVRRRVMQGGHSVPDDKVRKRYVESIQLMTEACEAAHRAYLFDNSGTRHKLLAEVEDLSTTGTITLHTSRLNPWFVNTALWQSFS